MRSKKEGFMGERQVKLSPMVVDIEEHDPLTASLYITDIGYYPKAENHHVKRSEGIDRVSGNLVGISINLCKSIQKELFINDTP